MSSGCLNSYAIIATSSLVGIYQINCLLTDDCWPVVSPRHHLDGPGGVRPSRREEGTRAQDRVRLAGSSGEIKVVRGPDAESWMHVQPSVTGGLTGTVKQLGPILRL